MARFRAAVLSLVALGALAVAAIPAGAAGANHARVIVDTGTQTIVRDISFDGSITGIQALQLAGADPVVYSFSGQGGAVCRLYGVGRDAGPGCLGGADGDPSYWQYFRAPAGTTAFTYSRAGAGSVQVRDGDVEGWSWGSNGVAPAWSTPAVTPPPTTPPPTAGSGGGTTAGGGTGPSGPAGAAAPATAAGGGVASPPAFDPRAVQALAEAANATTTSTTTGRATATEVAGARSVRPASRRAVDVLPGSGGGGRGGGSAWSLLLLGAVLAAIAGVGFHLRRSRRGPVR